MSSQYPVVIPYFLAKRTTAWQAATILGSPPFSPHGLTQIIFSSWWNLHSHTNLSSWLSEGSEFELAIYVRNTEDGTQILEQILPYFTPDFTVTVDLIPSLGRKYDMPVILNSVTPQTEYEGDMSTTRLIIWNLSFTVKGYIFPPVSTVGLIEQANTNIYTDSRSTLSQKVYVDYANGSGVLVTGEVVRSSSKNKTGTVVYFANNSGGTLVVSDLNDLLEEDDVIVGDYSNATYTINTVDLNPLKTVAIVTVPDPVSANSDDDFGFSETITEFPSTLT